MPSHQDENNEFGAVIEEAVLMHLIWRRRVVSSVVANVDGCTPEEARSDETCPFGKWLSGLGIDRRDDFHFHTVSSLHRRFHIEAASLLALGSSSLSVGEQWSRMDAASDELVAAMRDWSAVIPV